MALTMIYIGIYVKSNRFKPIAKELKANNLENQLVDNNANPTPTESKLLSMVQHFFLLKPDSPTINPKTLKVILWVAIILLFPPILLFIALYSLYRYLFYPEK